MELEFKQIAAYLPYEIKAQDVATKEIRTVTWLHFTYTAETVGLNHLIYEGLMLVKHKPILRPLSDYFGNKTGREVMDELNCSSDVVCEIWELADGRKNLDQISLKTYNVMCENHIDFNRLIESGLAVDINTIEPCKN